MDARHLSKRLETVAEHVPQGSRLADIGSDHAYLPANLALNKVIEYGIAGEVVRGPYENAVAEIKEQSLNQMVTARLADGLEAIDQDDNINVITICGMGGTLIRDILNRGQEKLKNHPLLILQPNVGAEVLRQWLSEHQYQIINEDILEEDDHIYEILIAEYTTRPIKPLSLLDLRYGPFLRRCQNLAFKQKWQKEIEKNDKAITQMKNAKQIPETRIKQLNEINREIKEVLNND